VTPPVRVAFLGNDPWSVPPLDGLVAAEDIAVDLVVTNPPRPAGRGSSLRPTRVAVAARALGLRVLEVDGLRGTSGPKEVAASRPDVLVVVAYGELLTREVLDLARLGAVNLHFSLLPRWRGAAPVQHAILEGDDVTGVTVMLMDEGLDTGPILAASEEPILPEDDSGTLGLRLAEIGSRLLPESLRALAAGTSDPRPQDAARATIAPRLTPEERRIDWGQPAGSVVRRVRALAPEPAASAAFRGGSLKVFRAAEEDASGIEPPGRVVAVDRSGVVVSAKTGAVRLLEVAATGRRRMSAADWARGARVAAGQRLE
jgi:methionyl-tRNA formyltransferase